MTWNDPGKQNPLEDIEVEDFYESEGYSSFKKKKKVPLGFGGGLPSLPEGFGKWAGIGAAVVVVLIIVIVLASKDSDMIRIDPQIYQRADALQARIENLEDMAQRIDTLEQQMLALQQAQRSFDTREGNLVTRMDQLFKDVERLKEKPAPQVAAPAPKPAAATGTSKAKYHVVQAGENLYRIGLKYNLSVEQIQKLNKLGPNDPIHVGQKLLVQPAK